MNKISIVLLGCLFMISSCGETPESRREEAETKGRALLHEARTAYANGEYQTAIQLIDSIRITYPLAMEVREQGILLKDSVYLEEAQEALKQAVEDNLTESQLEELQSKIKFYIRKLQHDKELRQTH